ncbi:hypothetical protein CBER1_03395 [Cercospora berteroae]|uniref:AB hydrolase-1 domain-containing protein n=1 Tax=Cercospora berteroae TaxID=357750 RepID=A0A2S6C8H0_9PEZI|nr:hypothetical protein CBER1_03395 [Cercospora berteroae]
MPFEMSPKNTLLLIFIHGFKGTDHTFHRFPQDLRALLSHSLPDINVVATQYPQYETRGDLKECVAKFKEWMQNKVIDLEVANQTPSPTVDPSVHVILCGHSMGGIVAAEAALSVAREEVVPHFADTGNSNATANSTTSAPGDESARSTPPRTSALMFPRIRAVLAFDTPFLGISPGVLAHGAEEQIGHANKAYQAYDQAANFFGWGNKGSAAAAQQPIANASSRGLSPATGNATAGNGGGFKWGKLAMYAGAAAGIAGVAGAAYLSWNQINQGLAWAGSHLEFVGCLARGAELQKRVEKLVTLTSTHDVGFANFYGALGEEAAKKTKYAGQLGWGEDRTFCLVPKMKNRNANSPVGTKRVGPDDDDAAQQQPEAKRRKQPSAESASESERLEAESEQVRQFADDRSKSKGLWVKCVNPIAGDEISSHQGMFAPDKNPDYHNMLPRARDQISEWIDGEWYERSGKESKSKEQGDEHADDDKDTEEGATDETEAAG